MAEGKKVVNVYTEWIEIFEALPDESAGKLIKHFFRYVNDQEPEPENELINIAFIPIKQQLKRDLKKWLNKSEKNKANALLRWSANNANACERIKPNANNADKDKVEVEDKDKVKDKDKYSNEIINFTDSLKQFFPFNSIPKDMNTWYKVTDEIIRIDKYQLFDIEIIVKRFRADEFWQNNFITYKKLRSKNKEGVKYIDYFANIIKNENNGSHKKTHSKSNATPEGVIAILNELPD